MKPAASVPVIANRRAGKGGDSIQRIEAALDRAGAVAEVHPADGAGVEHKVRELIVAGSPRIGVAGGDGTLLTAAGVLAGTSTSLALLPTGTLNHFARRLGIESIEDGAAALTRGQPTRVPIGIVDDSVFLNTATFGLYADVVRTRESLRRWLGKWPAAAVGFATRLVNLHQLEVTLEVGGERIHRRTPLVWIGIGWGSFPLVHQATERRGSPDLEIVVLRPGGRWGALALLARLSLAIRSRTRPLDDPALEFLHARRVLIHAEHRVGVTLDGEIRRLATPIFVGVQDEGLSICAPEPA